MNYRAFFFFFFLRFINVKKFYRKKLGLGDFGRNLQKKFLRKLFLANTDQNCKFDIALAFGILPIEYSFVLNCKGAT